MGTKWLPVLKKKHIFLSLTVTMSETNQVEHAQISTALEVEKLEEHLFRSKSLWVPTRARGVFGGQVISQALVSATNCIDPAFGLHVSAFAKLPSAVTERPCTVPTCQLQCSCSLLLEDSLDELQCYFLLSASPATPIVYQVEKLREGRSYASFSVKALQKGNIIFVLMCSFHKPEPWQPSYQWVMPTVPSPDDCLLEEDRHLKTVRETPDLPSSMKNILEIFAAERRRSPIAIKMAKEHEKVGTGLRYMYWMKAKNIPKYETPFQKVNASSFVRSRLANDITSVHSQLPVGPLLVSAILHSGRASSIHHPQHIDHKSYHGAQAILQGTQCCWNERK